MIDKTKYFDYPVPDLSNGIDIYYFCKLFNKTFNNVGKHDYTVNSESFYIRKVSIFDAIVRSMLQGGD